MSKWDMDDTGYDDGVKDTWNDIAQIIFEGEDTEIGRRVTIERIKTCIGYDRWLEEELNVQ